MTDSKSARPDAVPSRKQIRDAMYRAEKKGWLERKDKNERGETLWGVTKAGEDHVEQMGTRAGPPERCAEQLDEALKGWAQANAEIVRLRSDLAAAERILRNWYTSLDEGGRIPIGQIAYGQDWRATRDFLARANSKKEKGP